MSLSVDLSDEEREELIRELELDEDIEKVESRTTQAVTGVAIGIIVAETIFAVLKTDIAKEAAGKLKKVIKKVLTKAEKKKTKTNPELTLNYEDLVLHFTSTDDKKIDENINELLDYIQC